MAFIDIYRKLLSKYSCRDVSFGYQTIYLFDEEALHDGQIGYSMDEEGDSLIGEDEGYWRKEWIVIGYEEQCGDPIFVDINDEDYPVYTAAHGNGIWEPEIIAVSLENFFTIVQEMATLSEGRDNPVKLAENPLSVKEINSFLKNIAKKNEGIYVAFWETIFEI